MLYLTSSFSLQMIPEKLLPARLRVSLWDTRRVAEKLNDGKYAAAIGHGDTEEFAAKRLREAGMKLTGAELHNRRCVTLQPGDEMIVLQLVGMRLPEGCTELPEGAELKWFHLAVEAPGQPQQDPEMTSKPDGASDGRRGGLT